MEKKESPKGERVVKPVISLPSEKWVLKFGSIGKDSDAGRDWGQEEKGTTEDEMTGWHHRHDTHEFGWAHRVGSL